MTGAVRLFDPDTSFQAAQRIGTSVEHKILQMFALVDSLTDDELADLLSEFHPPTVKSARSRLSKRGVLRDSGVTRLSLRGSPMIVWTL